MDIITQKEAAEIKNCHRGTIKIALLKGDLDPYPIGKNTAVILNEKFEKWFPKKAGNPKFNKSY